MAIPTGTTGRQLGAIARWAHVGVIVAGALAWTGPGYRQWGAMTVGLLVVLAVWLVWRVVTADTRVPRNPVYLALLGPAAILVYHLAGTGLCLPRATVDGAGRPDQWAVGGAINMSMLYQLALLAAGVMLTQTLLGTAGGLQAVRRASDGNSESTINNAEETVGLQSAIALAVCGAAMVCGAAVAMAFGGSRTPRGPFALAGLAGAGTWISAIWILLPPRWFRIAWRGIGLIAAVSLCLAAPDAAMLATAVAGLVLASVILRRLRRTVLIAGAGAILGAIACLWFGRPSLLGIFVHPPGLWGRGEQAFIEPGLWAGSSGLEVIGATTGWAGLTWLVVFLAWGLLRRLPANGRKAIAVSWFTVTTLSTCALLASGGLFTPVFTLIAAVAWGLWPVMGGQESGPGQSATGYRRPKVDRSTANAKLLHPAASDPGGRAGPVCVVAVMVATALLLGITRNTGLLGSCVVDFGGSDKLEHSIAGFFTALSAGWILGRRSIWTGLAGVLLAVTAGAAGEVAQQFASSRGWEMGDWVFHVFGCAAATAVYLLAAGSRMCESADARPQIVDCRPKGPSIYNPEGPFGLQSVIKSGRQALRQRVQS
ncbi:MAG: hypothetical protein ACE15C_11945 [Phycisphaerae bacterium]